MARSKSNKKGKTCGKLPQVFLDVPPLENPSKPVDTSDEGENDVEINSFVPPWRSISFSCGGWLQFYLFGVARAFQATGLDKNVHLAGCSAGGLAAAGLALEGDFDASVEYCKTSCIPRAYGSVTGLFVLHEYVADSFDRFL